MKILQMLLSPRIGGAESLAYSLGEYWQSKGVDSKVAFLDLPEKTRRSRLSRILTVRREYRQYCPDLILSHSAIPNAYCRLALPAKVPVVPVLHSSADDYSSVSFKIAEHLFHLFRRDEIIAVSDVSRDLYVKHFGNARSIHVIVNGIKDPGESIRRGAKCVNVVTLARVSQVKNPWLWSDVVSSPVIKNYGLAFDWIGPVDNDSHVQQLVSRHNQVKAPHGFLGGRPDGASALSNYDLYFHPSDREALSLAVLEAVMSGLPVICSDAVAASMGSDLVSETFVSGDSASATEAVARAVNSYEAHIERSAHKRFLALQRYGIDSAGQKYLNIFNNRCE